MAESSDKLLKCLKQMVLRGFSEMEAQMGQADLSVHQLNSQI